MIANVEDSSRTVKRRMSFAEGLFLGALFLRCAWLAGLVKTPMWSSLLVDALTYHEHALKILAEGWLPTQVFERTPFYPYLIAIVYSLCGADPLWVRLLQAAVGAANCVLLYRIVTRIFDETTGRVAGIIAAAYGAFWLHEADLLTPVWIIFFILAGFWIMLPDPHREKSPSKFRIAVSGALTGIAGLVWPSSLFAAPGIWHIAARPNRLVKRNAVLIIATTVAVPLLLLLFHLIRFGEPLLSLQGGVNLYLGNHRGADGFSAIMPEAGPAWTFEDLRQAESIHQNRQVSWSELDTHYRNRALHFLFFDPLSAIKLYWQKLLLLFLPTEIPNTFDAAIFAEAFPWAKSAFMIGWWLVFPLALVGIGYRIYQYRWTTNVVHKQYELGWMFAIAGMSFGILLFFVNTRYRLPLVPLLIPYAAHTLVSTFRSRKQYRTMMVLSGSAVVSLVLGNINWAGYRGDQGAFGKMQLAIAYRNEHQYSASEKWFREALQADPGYLGLRIDLADLAFRRGDTLATRQYLQEEIANNERLNYLSGKAAVYSNAGNVYRRLGDFTEAENCYRKALESNPNLGAARRNLDRIKLIAGAQAFLKNDSTTAVSRFSDVCTTSTDEQSRETAQQLLNDLKAGMLRERLQMIDFGRTE